MRKKFAMNSVRIWLIAALALFVTNTAEARKSMCSSFDEPVSYSGVSGAFVRVHVCWNKHSNNDEDKAFIFTHGSTARGNQLHSGFQPKNFSITEKLVQMGWVVVYYDRVGTGDSTIPYDSSLVTIEATVDVMHQLTSGIRTNTLGGGIIGHHVSNVACAGASLGTGYTWEQAVRYPSDCDALVTWGAAHDAPPEFVTKVYPEHFFPAYLDSVIDDPSLFWDPSRFNPLAMDFVGMGYVTTSPMESPAPGGPAPDDTEWRQYYFLPVDDLLPNPHIVSVEEQSKSFVSSELLIDSVLRHALFQNPCGEPNESISCLISGIPVIQLYGTLDRAVCGVSGPGLDCSSEANVLAAEGPYYTTDYEVIPVEGAAHEIHFSSSIHEALEALDTTLVDYYW